MKLTMKRFPLLFVMLISLISCKQNSKETTQNKPSSDKNLTKKLDEYFTALSNLEKFNGVIYVTKNNQVLINKAYNLNKTSTTYVSTNSQFDIHSVSKLMACYLIEKFEIEGKLKKSQTLNIFIPDFPKGNKITIEMLLQHKSGLPRYLKGVKENRIQLSLSEIIDYAKKQEFLFEPGADTQYSNIGYNLVYYIIGQVSGKSFAQCLTDDLFKPLQMEHSGAHFYTQKKNLINLAQNHIKEHDSIVRIPNILDEETKTARIFSTATDLNKFLNCVNKEPYASLLKKENNVIEKSGGSDGVRAEVYTNLDYNYNFVLLTNYEEIPFQKTVMDLAKILEGKPYEIPKAINRIAVPITKDLLKKYVGKYTFPDMNNLNLIFKIKNDELVVYQDGEQIAILKAENESTFFDDPKEAESFEFVSNNRNSYNVIMGWKGVKLKGIRE